jgi:hypothetical protein
MSKATGDPLSVDDMERRQDEVLLELDELNRRVEAALAEWLTLRPEQRPPAGEGVA